MFCYTFPALSHCKKASPISFSISTIIFKITNLSILGSIFNKGCSEPAGDNSKEITEFEDGTIISYDSKNSVLLISAIKDISIKAGANINIEAIGNIKLTGAKIDLN